MAPRRVPFSKRFCVMCGFKVHAYTGSFYLKDPNQTKGPGKGYSIIHDHCRAEVEARQEAYDNRLFELDEGR